MADNTLRTEMLIGGAAVEKLRGSHVAVFGLGGVGSWCAEALVRTGVGELTIVDDDVFSETNINRQAGALYSTVGRAKTEVMAERLLDINPDLKLHSICGRYIPEERERFFADFDYIADAIDSVTSKVDLIVTAMEREIPILSSMGTGNKLDASKLQLTDLSKTSGCPLARVMRRELKKHGIAHLDVMFSTEEPIKPRELEALPEGKRSVPGSVMWVPAVAGLRMAQHIVMKLIED